MNFKKHLIWIIVIFLAICGLFYLLFVQGFLANRLWNDNANTTKCLVTDTNIVNVDCSVGNFWGERELRNTVTLFGAQNQLKCYDGLAIVKYINTSLEFDVAFGNYDEVNQTLMRSYPKGGCIDCLVQQSNVSDFRLQPKPETCLLTLAIVIPGLSILILIVWGLCVFFAQRRDPYGQY